MCASGFLPIEFDDQGQPLRLGPRTTIFTWNQRIAIAARDGGCIFEDCGLPASWTEAHHIDEWVRDHGETNIEDGVCLCATTTCCCTTEGGESSAETAGIT